ncbi:pentatricopeptide repeat-containing protein At3g29290-like [Tasmannia lanceolata]|uniref:pentatricopeptide repeat-containing protein At3g29290-like n=1 Tax=Tasmannia lanceolata TaxID=3420 RepID=UPI0040644243
MKEKETVTGHTYSLILKAVASAQGCDSALKMFVELEGERTLRRSFDAVVYNTMISVCGKANNWVQMEGQWRRLKEDGYSGTEVTYRVLVSTFVRCGQTELALDAFHEMVQNQLKPCEDVMKAIIGACAKEGKWALALDVIQLMLDSGLKPNAIAYNALINCLGKAGEVDLAFRIYNLMKSSGHVADVCTCNALLSAHYRGNRYADVLQLFERITREKSSDLNAHLYNVSLMSCQRLGSWDRSLQLLWHVEASGMAISTVWYNHVIGAFEAARKPEVALQVYKHMIHQKCNPDTFTYLSLIRSCVWGSLWAEVDEILDCVTPVASLYNALIRGMCLRGRTTLAKKLYKRMRNSGLKPDGKTWALMLQHLPKDS